MVKNNHLVVKKYLEDHSLVESNIISFNDFIERRMQEIVEEVSQTIDGEDFEINLGKIELHKPQIIEANGSTSLITPSEVRLRNLTYSAPITLEMTIKKDDQVDSQVVEIGRIPVMVKSKACNLYGMSKEELITNYEDPTDSGGYFLINGNERVMVMAEDLSENQPFIETNSKGNLTLRMFSSKGTYRIPMTISEDKEGIFNISSNNFLFRRIPCPLWLKTRGVTASAAASASSTLYSRAQCIYFSPHS